MIKTRLRSIASVPINDAGCIYSMPITRCPFCDQKFPSDNEGGLFILPVEPFATDADTAAAKPSGDSEDDRVDRDGEPQTRFCVRVSLRRCFGVKTWLVSSVCVCAGYIPVILCVGVRLVAGVLRCVRASYTWCLPFFSSEKGIS